MAGKVAFVLAATDHGPMILNRLDFKVDGKGNACGVGIMLLEQGSHEQGEIALMLQLVRSRATFRPGQTMVLDVGANIGTHTIAMARAMERWGQVIAIEPQERIFYALAGNIAVNNCFNAQALWAAAGNVDGSIRVPRLNHQAPANFGGLSLKVEVAQDPGQVVSFAPEHTMMAPAIRIDDMALPRVDLIKIDVEGMEPEVLSGAQDTIKRCRPIIFAERGTCGEAAVAEQLDGYRLQAAGMAVLAMPANDPVWAALRVIGK